MIVESFSANDTYQFGRLLGEKLKPGAVVCLDGDLGVGKTVFVKGVAAGLGITEPVVSPTFTIVCEYKEGRIPMYHMDVYRIEDPEELYEIGYEEYLFGDGVCLIEWSELIRELIPAEAIRVKIAKDLDKGLSYRSISVDFGGAEEAMDETSGD